jgi:hypothetical protein
VDGCGELEALDGAGGGVVAAALAGGVLACVSMTVVVAGFFKERKAEVPRLAIPMTITSTDK